MRGTVFVMTPNEYERWAMGETGQMLVQSPVQAGEQLFTQLGCVTCHHPESGALGADVNGVFGHEVLLADGTTVIADEDYLRESILYPQAKIVAGYQPIMPTFRGLVNETQLMQIIAYLKSLGGQEESGVQP
jgi:cytochrome c oxidase subunit 2